MSSYKTESLSPNYYFTVQRSHACLISHNFVLVLLFQYSDELVFLIYEFHNKNHNLHRKMDRTLLGAFTKITTQRKDVHYIFIL